MSKLSPDNANSYIGGIIWPVLAFVGILSIRYILRACHKKGKSTCLYRIFMKDDRHEVEFKDKYKGVKYNELSFGPTVSPLSTSRTTRP
jgi:hypothetical protein